VRSERLLTERSSTIFLFRWFVGLSMDDAVRDATVFCKNRDHLLNGDIARNFMTSVLNLPQARGLLSSEQFSVDGTLIEAWASMKSFVPKDGGDAPRRAGRGGRNAERDFHGEKRTNDTHFSITYRTRASATQYVFRHARRVASAEDAGIMRTGAAEVC
jgi:hypothetical protein